jgi:predicted patatin/cPLA2 family phospholipase
MNLSLVVDRLLEKKRLLAAGDDRHKEIRTLALIPGRGMRGVYSAGAMIALKVLGLDDVFDNIVGISTGAGVASYFFGTTEDAIMGCSIYLEDATKKDFINTKRWKRIMDMEFLHQVMRHEKPLNDGAIRSQRSGLWTGVTDFETGQGALIDAKKAKPDITTAMIASMSVPGSFENPLTVNGRTYIDGDIALPVPIELMVQMFRPTDILVLVNQRRSTTREGGVVSQPQFREVMEDFLLWATVRRRPLQRAILAKKYRLKEGLDYMNSLTNIHIGIINPPDKTINSLTQNTEKLRSAMHASFEETLDVFGRQHVDKDRLQAVSSQLFKQIVVVQQ